MSIGKPEEGLCQFDSRLAPAEKDPALSLNSSRSYKCICQLCTCGKHRCPRPHIKGEFQTSYSSQYQPIHHKVAVSPPPSYQYQERHYDPEALKTRYKETFVPPQPPENQQLSSSRLEQIGRSVFRPHVPFTGTSSYQDQFKSFELKAANNPEDPYLNVRQNIPDYGFTSPAKFQGKSAYKEYFQAPSPPQINHYPYHQYRKPEVPFYGSSTYQQEFKPAQLPQQTYQAYSHSLSSVPRVPFEGKSSYRDSYQDHKVQSSRREENPGGQKCVLEGVDYPQRNFMDSSSPHLYYDQASKRFV